MYVQTSGHGYDKSPPLYQQFLIQQPSLVAFFFDASNICMTRTLLGNKIFVIPYSHAIDTKYMNFLYPHFPFLSGLYLHFSSYVSTALYIFPIDYFRIHTYIYIACMMLHMEHLPGRKLQKAPRKIDSASEKG